MATYKSDWKIAVDLAAAGSRTAAPNRDLLAYEHNKARFLVTPVGTEANGEYVVLGRLESKNARIIPEGCRIRFSSDIAGTPDVKFQLKKATNVATPVITALSAVTATVAATTVPITFASLSGASDTIALNADDELRLYLSTGASTVALPTAGKLIVEISYDSIGC